MGIREVLYISKSGNKIIVGIGPTQHGLNGLQEDDETSCPELAISIIEHQSDI